MQHPNAPLFQPLNLGGLHLPKRIALAEAGAHVLVHYGRSAQDAESLVAGIHAKGGRADAIKADLGTPDGPPPDSRKAPSYERP